MSAPGAESPSGSDVIVSIFTSVLSPNAVDGVRTGLANFTVREKSEILDDDRDKISRSGKRVLANQKYRQAQPGDVTVFSMGVARAHSKTVRMTVKWFGCGETQRQAKIVSLNNSGIYKIVCRIDHRSRIINGRDSKPLLFLRYSTPIYAGPRQSPTPTRWSMGLCVHCSYWAFRSCPKVHTNCDTIRVKALNSWILYSDHPAISAFSIINERQEKARQKEV